MTNKDRKSAPLWVWLLGLSPWIWIIPFNQYFWDDWYNASVTGFGDQIDRWNGTAKHWVNPFVFYVLQLMGPWAFHVVIVSSTVVGAIALTRILDHLVLIPVELARWSGPIFLVLPVFHARFSAATLEYSLSLAALLGAWSLLLDSRGVLREGVAVLLLVFAIGVPSLAILYPFIWIHLVTSSLSSFSWSKAVKVGLRYVYVLFVPLMFSLVFSIILNAENKYKIFSDGWIDWRNDFVRLFLLSILVVAVAYWLDRPHIRNWIFVVALGHLVYFSFFPYFQVGYKPLNDFLPWRMRSEIRGSLQGRILFPAIVLTALACLGLLLASQGKFKKLKLHSTLALLFTIILGVASSSLGPLDWESRHWLIAWPCIVVFLLALASVRSETDHRGTAVSIFVVCLGASLYISSEYLVDTLKQKAIIRATRTELIAIAETTNVSSETVIVVIEPDSTSERLNARLRKYRPYEWWGLIALGLDMQPRNLKILEEGDFRLQAGLTCKTPLRAAVIRPRVLTSRFETLRQLRVDLRFDARPIRMCSVTVKEGWPRDN